MELSAGSHGLPGRGRGSGISAARHWVSHPTGGWNCAAAVVFSRGPRNLPDRGRVPGNGRSGDRDADAKEAENLLSPRAQHAQARADDVCTWGEASGKSHPLTRGGSGEWAFVYAQTTVHVVATTTVRWWSFVHQRRGSDIWPDDKNLALQLTGSCSR